MNRKQAIHYAMEYNPSLQGQRAELRALQAEITQAKTRPNPEMDFEIENFAGTGGSRGLDGAEITTAMTQPLETAGKRSKRTRVAAMAAEAYRAGLLSKELALTIATDRLYTTLLEALELRELSQKNLTRAEENLTTLESLLEAGERGRIDVNKARLTVSEARDLLAEASADVAIAAAELSATWGDGDPDFRVADKLSIPGGRVAASVGDTVSKHPAVREADLRLSLARADLELEKAKRYPDIAVGGGVRELRDAGETAAVAGVSIPLPLFDRNQGNIRAAEERVARAEAARLATESKLRSRFNQLSAELLAARERATEFDSRTIEAATQALEDTNQAYASGKASLLEVLDARRTLFSIEMARTRAMADLLRAHNSLKFFTQN